MHAIRNSPADYAVCWQTELSYKGYPDDVDDADMAGLATAQLWKIDNPPMGVPAVLDDVGHDLAGFCSMYDDNGFLLGGVEVSELGTSLLVADRLSVSPEFRGNGFGLLLLAESINLLADIGGLVCCEPSPFELLGTSASPVDWELGKERLIRIWTEFGFSHWEDGMFYLDPGAEEVSANRESIRSRFA